ncbi:hypothetical protein ACMFMG_004192 [Clarireedia jacksonii]
MFGALHRKNMEEEEKENLLESEEILILPAKREQFIHILLTFSVSLNIFFILFGLFVLISKSESVSHSSYDHGFSTDLEPVKSEIELIVKSFNGGVELQSDGSFSTDSGGREYVGSPAPEVDEAWETLLGGLNLDFDKTEVDLSDSTFQWPESGLYFSGLDVYHSLHCLNRLRQAIYPEYYRHIFDRPTDPSRVNHIGHCINHIRQSLQCHADLTPMEWRLIGDKIIIKTDTQHTCRNFEKINEWALSKRTKFEYIQSWRNGSLRIVD